MLFSELPLKPELLKAVEELGFTQPTPVQEKSIPLLIEENRDLIGLAQTGTGKTAAFGLPMIHRIDVKKKYCSRTCYSSNKRVMCSNI